MNVIETTGLSRWYGEVIGLNEITVKVEVKPDQQESAGELLPKLGKDLAAAHEGLRFNVEAVTHGSLPRFELKAKRLKDEREYQ